MATPCAMYGTPLTNAQQEAQFPRLSRKGIHRHGNVIKFLQMGVGKGSNYPNEVSDDGSTIYYCESPAAADCEAMENMREQKLPVRVLLIIDINNAFDWGQGRVLDKMDSIQRNGRMYSRYVIERVGTVAVVQSLRALLGNEPRAALERAEREAATPGFHLTDCFGEIRDVVKARACDNPSAVELTLTWAALEHAMLRQSGSSPGAVDRAPSSGPTFFDRAPLKRPRPAAQCTKYRGRWFKSLLEACHAFMFDKLEVEWEYEQQTIHDADGHSYTIDFWLPGLLTYVEIKPRPPYDDEMKRCVQQCARTRRDVVLLYNTGFVTPVAGAPTGRPGYEHADGIRGIKFRFCGATKKVVMDEPVMWMERDGAVVLAKRDSYDDMGPYAPVVVSAFKETAAHKESPSEFEHD